MFKSDNLSKRIFAVGLSVSAVLLSGSLFMMSIAPASANSSLGDRIVEAIPPVPATSGKIMMDYTSVHVPSQDKTYYECMVWDTETGDSRLYYYNYTDKKFKMYEENVQLPSSPLSH